VGVRSGTRAMGHRGVDVQDGLTDKAISRAVGEELRRRREAAGWSRAELVARLPSGIGDRTLLSYEHGTRHLTVLRLIELCRPLGVSTPALLASALQRARIYLENLDLRIDLHALLDDKTDRFRPMAQWARNKLNQCPGGIVEVGPAVVSEIALFMGCDHRDLATYLVRFTPEDAEPQEDDASTQ
jgi:transcriptional regulator with XRE-family HTH domain